MNEETPEKDSDKPLVRYVTCPKCGDVLENKHSEAFDRFVMCLHCGVTAEPIVKH